MLINNDLKPNILTDLFDLFFPEDCINCGKLLEVKGKYFCLSCLSEMPLTYFSFHVENELERSFKGRIPLQAATSLLYFEKKGLVQRMIHELKYHQKPQIGAFLGKWLGGEMVLSKRFDFIDFVVPVPLHPQKERKRGYNQVHSFAESLAYTLNAESNFSLLIKNWNRNTQTQKNRQERMMTQEKEYTLKETNILKNSHILLVDDIVTSGSTLQACADALLHVKGIKLSLATMAYTV